MVCWFKAQFQSDICYPLRGVCQRKNSSTPFLWF